MKASGGAGWLLRSQQDGGADLVGQDNGRGGRHGIELAVCCMRAHCAGWSAAESMAPEPSAHRTTLNARMSDRILRSVRGKPMLDIFSSPGRPSVCDLRHPALV